MENLIFENKEDNEKYIFFRDLILANVFQLPEPNNIPDRISLPEIIRYQNGSIFLPDQEFYELTKEDKLFLKKHNDYISYNIMLHENKIEDERYDRYQMLNENGSLSIIPVKVFGEELHPSVRLELFEKRTVPIKNPQGYLSLDKDDKLLFQKYNNENKPISFEKPVELRDMEFKSNLYDQDDIDDLIDEELSYEKYEEFEHLYKEARNDEPKQVLINEENPKTMEENKVDHPANEYYEKFRSNPTSSFINHHDIFSIMMSKLPQKDKLDLINEMTKNETPLENLKGLNKGTVIDTIVKPIIANNSPEDIMAFKGKVNAMKDAAETNYQDFKKTEKGEIKFVESKVSAEEYSKFLMENKDSIINAEKNASSVSTSLLLLAYLENRTAFLAQDKTKENVDFADILVKSGVSPERAAEFTKIGIFNHTPVTNELKKLTARDINSNPENVYMFKNLTKTHPTKNVAKDVDVNLENDNKNQVKR